MLALFDATSHCSEFKVHIFLPETALFFAAETTSGSAKIAAISIKKPD
jgi:hypothetical protein